MMGFSTLLKASLLALPLLSGIAGAEPVSTSLDKRQTAASSYWYASIKHQGQAAFGDAGNVIWRNVKDYGAKGDGSTDDTEAINKAVKDGPNRCMDKCDSRTNAPAIVYFPPGTYVVSKPIIQSYYTQFIGDAVELPTLKAAANFEGMAVIDANPYADGGVNWYINQNNFFRQVRNFVIDLTGMPSSTGAGIHWQVAQATSLQNIVFNMNPEKSSKNQQKGVFIDNGSGGFMSDLTFNGGGYGIDMGSQQFTLRNMTFNNCYTAIHFIWNWQFLLQDMKINGANIGVDMTAFSTEELTVGSVILLDSKISNTAIGVSTLYKPDHQMTNNTLIMENVDMSEAVPTAVQHKTEKTVLLPGNQVIKSFTQGRQYEGSTGKAIQTTQNPAKKPEALMSNGKVFTRSKPQYTNIAADQFISVKSAGAKGDGKTDDTAKLQQVFNNAKEGQVVFVDHGAYVITDTIQIPKNIKITGEIWSLLMASGPKFADQSKPRAVLQVGKPGDVGNVEMSDLIIETKGPAPGAILMEWNLEGSEAGSAGMWDVHFRVGGTAGSQLQSDKCAKTPKQTTTPNPECEAAFMMLHLTKTASAYVENCWFWIADHELDLEDHKQINLYNGRGVLIESQKPVWFWGTASEHSQMYNYQVTNAENVFLGMIQTETAYMQGNPDATVPFTANAGYSDPDFKASCDGSSQTCARTWGLRVANSTEVFMYGGGLYSFFDNYGQVCVNKNNCQENIVSVEESSVHFFGVNTKASVNMITNNGKSVALDKDNRSTFCGGIARWESSGGPAPGSNPGGSSSGGSGSESSSSEAPSATAPSSGSGSGSAGSPSSTPTASTGDSNSDSGSAGGSGSTGDSGSTPGSGSTGSDSGSSGEGSGSGSTGGTDTGAGSDGGAGGAGGSPSATQGGAYGSPSGGAAPTDDGGAAGGAAPTTAAATDAAGGAAPTSPAATDAAGEGSGSDQGGQQTLYPTATGGSGAETTAVPAVAAPSGSADVGAAGGSGGEEPVTVTVTTTVTAAGACGTTS